jgi:hypothetical protein
VLKTAGVLSLLLIAYLASPFVTAWSIREAVRSGDSAYLQTAIDWPGVRETLKSTLSRLALDMPDPEDANAPKPGVWQRIKAYVGQSAVNRAVDSYITPEGLPKLFTWRKYYRDNISGEMDEAKTLPLGQRIKAAWARVKRAEFTGPTQFEIDMADKHDPNRIYLGKLEFTGLGWKLKELRIKFLTSASNAVEKAKGASSNLRFISPAEAATR